MRPSSIESTTTPQVEQRDLFDRFHEATVQIPAPPHVNSSTSRQAAQRIRPDANRLRQAVLEYVTGCGEAGATDEETQLALGLAGNTQRPRRRELVRAGLVVDSGRTRPTASGRAAVVWREATP